MDEWRTALRATLRGLGRSPGFTLTVVLTLALGIGTTAALFTLVYDVILRPLPYPDPARLVVINEKVAEWSHLYPVLPVSANHFTNWERNSHSFSAMTAMEPERMPLGTGGRPREIGMVRVTAGFFATLKVAPRLGRAFSNPRDPNVILMDGLWRDQFGADPNVLGRKVTLDGYPYTVIGVMPRSFHIPPVEALYGSMEGSSYLKVPIQAITPLEFPPGQLANPAFDLDYPALGRMKPGVSVGAATGDLNRLQHTISAELPPSLKETLSVKLTPLQQQLVGSSQRPMEILLAAVLGLLLIGCGNIANLMLARGVGRRRQTALACALGAGRWAILRMALRETAVLAIIGGLLGIGLATALVPWMQQYLPQLLNFRGTLHLNWAGAGCALLLAAIAMFVSGGVPAWMASRVAPREVLHSEARLATEAHASRRVRRLLVGVEAALSISLLLLAGLTVTSVERLLHVHKGFTVEKTMTAHLELPSKQYGRQEQRTEFYRALLAKLRALPGAEHAAVTSTLPLSGNGWGSGAVLPEDKNLPLPQIPIENFRWVSPQYFSAIGLPLVRGRVIQADDFGKNVAVVSEKTARTLWHGADPVGRTFWIDVKEKPFTVIGVVGNARTVSLRKPDPMLIYVPYWYRNWPSVGLVLRTHQDPSAMEASIRKAVWSIDPSVPVPAMRTLGNIVAGSVANSEFERDLLVLFSISALLLAGLGVYGVVSYSVAQRRREIGLRVALGAQPANLYAMVLLDGLVPVALGIVAGVALVFSLSRLVRALLFGVTPYDPLVLLAATLVLLLAGAAGCLLPARRAANIEPMEALRAE